MKERVFIAIPSGEGKPDVDMFMSVQDNLMHLHQTGVGTERVVIHGNCYIAQVRSLLTHKFMQTDCSHLFFWDDDVAAPPSALSRLLSYDRDIAVGPYPKKVPAHSPPEAGWPFILTDGIPDAFGLLECEKVATGFLLIKRKVIETLYEEHADRVFHHDPFDADVVDIFPTGLVPGFPVGTHGKPMWWGEDYAFSVLAKRAGFKMWLDPVIPLIHAGRNVWRGEFTRNSDAAWSYEAFGRGSPKKGSPFASQPPHMPAAHRVAP